MKYMGAGCITDFQRVERSVGKEAQRHILGSAVWPGACDSPSLGFGFPDLEFPILVAHSLCKEA